MAHFEGKKGKLLLQLALLTMNEHMKFQTSYQKINKMQSNESSVLKKREIQSILIMEKDIKTQRCFMNIWQEFLVIGVMNKKNKKHQFLFSLLNHRISNKFIIITCIAKY
jgi:hypothetical protein